MYPMRSWCRLFLVALAMWPATSLADGAADYFVHQLPGAPEGPLLKMHAGLVEVSPEHHGNFFFWHFQNEHIANRQRTVIWLNGGPGCSSEDGALMEIGPYRVKDPETLVRNNGSWNEFANLLFVDNPVGTGFSVIDTNSYVKELDEMAAQFVTFLEKWFALFPEYEHDDIYIAGESYAGQHIPYIARSILERNKQSGIPRKWNLKGLLIGNGWISPVEQYDSYLNFAYEKGLLAKDGELSESLEQQWRTCKRLLSTGDLKVDYPDCEAILQDMLSKTKTGGGKTSEECYNMYDVRLRDSYPSCGMNWPADLAQMQPYLHRREVIDALHITTNQGQGWVECNGAVGAAFRARNSKPSITFLPEILSEIPVLLFSGAEDLICNHIGTEKFIANMAWNGGKGFEITPGNWAPRRDWTFEDEPAGFWQEARNLTYVLFYNASHMVPYDYPRRTRDMLDRFMGVDISSIGGQPADSRLDGEAGPATSVGGGNGDGRTHAPSDEVQEKLDDAKWQAYERSGEVVLIIVVIAAGAWGYFVWRDRRSKARRGYQGLSTGPDASLGRMAERIGFVGIKGRRRGGGGGGGDIEAGDFDENRLDDLHVASPTDDDVDERYSVGGDSDDDEDDIALPDKFKRTDQANDGNNGNGSGSGSENGQETRTTT